ncbi:NEP-interacting protein [Tanacetum coccineum]
MSRATTHRHLTIAISTTHSPPQPPPPTRHHYTTSHHHPHRAPPPSTASSPFTPWQLPTSSHHHHLRTPITTTTSSSTPPRYAIGYVTQGEFYEAKAHLNAWAPNVTRNDFSSSSIWIISGDPKLASTLSVGWEVNFNMYKNNDPRLYISWTGSSKAIKSFALELQ